jgi:hypothetical protein
MLRSLCSRCSEIRKLTEADRLNGIEWDGTAVLKCTAARTQDPRTKQWSAWSDCFGAADQFQMTRRSDGWRFSWNNLSKLQAVPCNASSSAPVESLDKAVAVLSRNLSLGVVSYLLNGGQPTDCFGTPDCRNKIPGMFGTNSVPVEVTISVKFKDAHHYVVTAAHSQGHGRRCTFQPALEHDESPKKQCEPPLTKGELAELYPSR